MASKSAHDRETAILAHLMDGPKPEQDFSQGLREYARRFRKPMKTTAVGGTAGLMRCWRAGWIESAPTDDISDWWQLTEEGRAELARRQ